MKDAVLREMAGHEFMILADANGITPYGPSDNDDIASAALESASSSATNMAVKACVALSNSSTDSCKETISSWPLSSSWRNALSSGKQLAMNFFGLLSDNSNVVGDRADIFVDSNQACLHDV